VSVKENRGKGALVIVCAALICQLSAMTANPILSRGKTVYTSSGNSTILTDDKFGPSWNAGNNSWLAINVGTGHSKVFVNWNVPYTNWFDSVWNEPGTGSPVKTCGGANDKGPVAYTFQTSSNSTNGSDGTWTTALTITGNKVSSRGHVIPFTDASWVKMNITVGGVALDEFEVFDMSNNGTDIWFFPGTSISQMTYKSTPPTLNFADVVHTANPTFNPVMIRAGIGCILSVYVSTLVSFYLDMSRGAKYWAIEMGTNDAYNNGVSGLAAFKTNMQIIIDSCKAAGVQPIIARLLSTDSSKTKWQVNYAYETTIDSMTKANKLIPGPDLYTYFLNHPEEHNPDGIHPNPTGAASIQRLWAQKMDSLYKTTSVKKGGAEPLVSGSARSFSLSAIKGRIGIQALCAGVLRLFTTNGALFKTLKIPAAGSYSLPMPTGLCIARFSSKIGSEETSLVALH
jgi:lysophospholipase L1-like esterase